MPKILDDEFLRKIDRLILVSKKVRIGSIKGERRSLKRGTSVEFADYRNYTAGDDLRQVDWNVYARLEKVFLKLFEEEEELTVHILLDASRSMDWSGADLDFANEGQPFDIKPKYNKLLYAKKTAAALCYMALAALDRVTITGLGASGDQNETRFPLTRGKNQTVRMLRYLENLRSGGSNNLEAEMKTYAKQARYTGLLVIISDLLAPGGVFEGIKALQGVGFEVMILHVLAPDEVNPEVRGDVRLVDVETGEQQEVSIDAGAIELYRQEFVKWQNEIYNFCQRRGINYIQVETSLPFDELVLHYMRQRGLVA
jgi:uncharacterized protein (DUF58 family)